MADYHVGCGIAGIYAGTLNSRNKNLWQNKSLVTDEAVDAVRDYMRSELRGGEIKRAYEWTLKKGGKVRLVLEVVNDEKRTDGERAGKERDDGGVD
jgi:hypothetical protein